MARSTLTVPAAEANRAFSRLLRAARDGARITITSHGEPVAELGPARDGAARLAESRRRREVLLSHLRSAQPKVVESWARDELHGRGEWRTTRAPGVASR